MNDDPNPLYAEVTRLRESNKELLAALTRLFNMLDPDIGGAQTSALEQARRALAHAGDGGKGVA